MDEIDGPGAFMEEDGLLFEEDVDERITTPCTLETNVDLNHDMADGHDTNCMEETNDLSTQITPPQRPGSENVVADGYDAECMDVNYDLHDLDDLDRGDSAPDDTGHVESKALLDMQQPENKEGNIQRHIKHDHNNNYPTLGNQR